MGPYYVNCENYAATKTTDLNDEVRLVFVGGSSDGRDNEYRLITKTKKEWAIEAIKCQPFFS